MSRLRVVLSTGSYWPHVSESDRNTQRLAQALIEGGMSVRVVTPQLGEGPLGRFWDGSIPVFRLRHGPNSWWGPMRYWFALADWLKSNRESYDFVYACGLDYAAYAASQAMSSTPERLVLRAESAGVGGDCDWLATARFGSRVRARCKGHRIVAATESIAGELIDSGFDPQQINTIENPIDLLPHPTRQQQDAARDALRNAHASLLASAIQPVVVCVGTISDTESLPPLLAMWKRVVADLPAAQLWLIGQGRAYDIVPRLAERQGLELSIAAPGMFDCLDEVYQAADLVLLPFDTGGQSLAALEAMAYGLPVATVDSPRNRALLGNGMLATLLDPDPHRQGEQLGAMLRDPETLQAKCLAARDQVAARHSSIVVADKHRELFESLLAAQPTREYRAAIE